MHKVVESAGAPAGIREYADTGGRLTFWKQADLSVACVSSGLEFWSLFSDLNMIPHFPPSGLAGLRRRSSFPLGRALHMYLSHLVKGRQPNDCDPTSWYPKRIV